MESLLAVLSAMLLLQAPQVPGDQAQVPKAPPPRVQDVNAPPRVVLPAPEQAIPPEANRPLSAEEAARIALHFQPLIEQAKGNAALAHGRTTQAKAGLLPQLVAGAGYDRLKSISGGSVQPTQTPTGFLLSQAPPVDLYSAQVFLRQLVYDFNQTRNLVRQSQASEKAALSNLDLAQSNLVNTVKSAYYTYAAAEKLVTVDEQNLENRQRQLDLAKSRNDNGVGLPSDVVTAETSKSQAILALNQARDAADQAKVNLLTQMGIDPLTPITLANPEEPPFTNPDPRVLVKTALKRRPEIRAAEQAVLASRYGVDAAKAVDAPSLYAGLGAGTRGFEFPLNDSTVSFQLSLNFPIFDGGTKAGAVQASKGQLTASEAQLQATIQAVRGDVASAFLSLKSAEQRVAIAENEVANAREGVRIAEGRYSNGLGLFLDITNAQSLLLGALTDQTQARLALSLARTKIRYAVGAGLDGLLR